MTNKPAPPTLEDNFETAEGKVTATTGVVVDAYVQIASVSDGDGNSELRFKVYGNRHTINGMLDEFFDEYHGEVEGPAAEPVDDQGDD